MLTRAAGWLLRLDTLTSALTLVAMWLISEHSAWGWAVGLVNQVCWGLLIGRKRLWGLVPLTFALSVLYSRGLWLWW